MKFTFGIVTSGTADEYVNAAIDSIERQSIPEYEVLVVGNSSVERSNTTVIPFDEGQKRAWITRKKNLITQNAKYDNVVYAHDYIKYADGWYDGWVEFGEDYYNCMNPILNTDGVRYRDWSIWPHNGNFMDGIMAKNKECLIPYTMTHLSDYMYFSGAYWVSKKHVMEEFPLDERLSWGESEDVTWSMQVRQKYKFSVNPNSVVQLLKHKPDRAFNEPDAMTLEQLEGIQ